MGLAEIVHKQIKALPKYQAKEVLEFIGHLKSRQEQTQRNDLMLAQGKPLAKVWNNPNGKVWNHV